jgi:hypothetical protein
LSEYEAVVEGAVEVAQDPLESDEMGLPWGVHMEAHLLGGFGDVGPGEGDVPERAYQALVRRRIDDRGPIILRELCLSVDMHGTGLAVRHASSLQNVDGILALVQEETLGPVFRGDARK